MQTYSSFNALAAAQHTAPLQSQMSVFNAGAKSDSVGATVHNTQSEHAEFLKSDEYRMAQQTLSAAHDAIFNTMEQIQNKNPELADQLFHVIENLERFQGRLRIKGLPKMPSKTEIEVADEE